MSARFCSCYCELDSAAFRLNAPQSFGGGHTKGGFHLRESGGLSGSASDCSEGSLLSWDRTLYDLSGTRER